MKTMLAGSHSAFEPFAAPHYVQDFTNEFYQAGTVFQRGIAHSLENGRKIKQVGLAVKKEKVLGIEITVDVVRFLG